LLYCRYEKEFDKVNDVFELQVRLQPVRGKEAVGIAIPGLRDERRKGQ
jgi:hypothetical protein